MTDPRRPVESWWRASAGPAPERPPLDGEIRTDVAIIGAGYAGLACARRIAERGASVVALDAGAIGWGASGRNGGVVGFEPDMLGARALAARFGASETRAYYHALIYGMLRLRAYCEAAGVEIQGRAEALVAPHTRAFEALQARAADLPSGASGALLSRGAYAERGFEGPHQHGALLIEPGFALHPLRLVRALAAAAEDAGAEIHERSEVLRWRREGRAHRLETVSGAVLAERVVIAANGFTPDDLHPALNGRAMPVISMIGVTRPLSQGERGAHRFSEDGPFCTTHRLLHYMRMLPQNRLLFGMRGDLRGAAANEARWRAHLARAMGRYFPEWREVPLDFFWRGPICATRAMRPAIGALDDDPSVVHAFGWHGSGVNAAQVGGRMAAELALDGEIAAIPAPFRGSPPRIPAPGLRPLWLGGAIAAQRLADAWDAR